MAARSFSSVTATAQLQPFKLFKLDEGPASTATCSREEALKFYEMMQRIRRMETTLSTLYKEKKVRGFCHLYSGQVRHVYVYLLICGMFSNDMVFLGSRCCWR